MVTLAIVFAVLGSIAGSFISALTWRIHEGKDFVRSRSQCVVCGHQLGPLDLVPLISFLALRGRCRHCRNPIPLRYPLIELGGALWFTASYIFWPAVLGSSGQLTLFVTWLAVSVGLLALIVYDLSWMILPNKIIYPAFATAVAGRSIYTILFAPSAGRAALSWLASVAVASGLFFILHEVSKGQWIGFGDVRLGLITGTLLADPAKSLLMILVASILGTIYALPHVFAGRKTLNTRIPYGPFLILATLIVVLAGPSIIDGYLHLVTP